MLEDLQVVFELLVLHAYRNWCKHLCVLAWNCFPTYDLACNRTCECAPACTPSYEFPLVFQCVPTCENLLENDVVTPKLHNTRYPSSSQLNINIFFSIVVMLI